MKKKIAVVSHTPYCFQLQCLQEQFERSGGAEDAVCNIIPDRSSLHVQYS